MVRVFEDTKVHTKVHTKVQKVIQKYDRGKILEKNPSVYIFWSDLEGAVDIQSRYLFTKTI